MPTTPAMPSAAALATRARTKIVATVGPACDDVAMLTRLIRAGVSVFRINTAHGTVEEREQMLAAIRQASADSGWLVGVLVDLAGPKIRLGTLHTDPTECKPGTIYRFIKGNASSAPDELTCSYPELI